MGSEPKRFRAFIKDPQHVKRVIESVQVFSLRQDFVDLCFVCARGHRVFAHKLLFCSVSTQLKEMFLELRDSNDVITVHLPDVEARIVRFMLEFLYEGVVHITTKADHIEFNKLKEMLGIVLHRAHPSGKASEQKNEVHSSTIPIQPQAVLYVQTPGHASQGQTQYVLATPATLSQGQMMQVAQSTTPGQLVQVPLAQASSQVMQVGTPNSSMPQGQIMSQANNQMVQGGTQVGSTTVQQNNVMQVVSQNNAQVMPVVIGNQMVQCTSQMVLPPTQPTLINNNQMQNNNENQPSQPNLRPRYVTSSSADHTTSQAQAHYTQPHATPQQQIVSRSRTIAQVSSRVSNVDRSSMMQEILTILQENCYNLETIESLTARQLREILEPKLGVDLSSQEELIEQVLKSFQQVSNGKGKRENSSVTETFVKKRKTVSKRRRQWKSRVSLSDDENDLDFDPKKPQKKSRRK